MCSRNCSYFSTAFCSLSFSFYECDNKKQWSTKMPRWFLIYYSQKHGEEFWSLQILPGTKIGHAVRYRANSTALHAYEKKSLLWSSSFCDRKSQRIWVNLLLYKETEWGVDPECHSFAPNGTLLSLAHKGQELTKGTGSVPYLITASCDDEVPAVVSGHQDSSSV